MNVLKNGVVELFKCVKCGLEVTDFFVGEYHHKGDVIVCAKCRTENVLL